MSANNSSRKYRLWVILASLLVVGMIATPDLWASPGRNPGRQTVPPGTLTHTPAPSTPTDEPTAKPTKKPAPNDPTPVPEDTPTFTPVPISTFAPTSTPIPPTAETVTASPSIAATASPTTVPAHTATLTPSPPTEDVATSTATPIPEEQAVAEDVPSSASTQPTITTSTQPEGSPIPPPVSDTPTQMNAPSDVDVEGFSPLFCGGIGMVVMGMILLVVWRLRA